jgi:outer membrane receptor protein involved in Fe transport
MTSPDPTKHDLSPEQTWHAELQLQLRPNKFVAARLSGYVRRIDGLIRLDPAVMMNPHDINLGTIDVRGLETGVDVARDRIVGGGATYIFEDAYSPTLGFDAIPNFPRHRVDAYVSSSWRRRVGGLVRFRWVSERVVQATVLPRYYVMELDLWARLWSSLRASVRVDNLTNNRYLLLPGLTALGTTVTVTLDGIWP